MAFKVGDGIYAELGFRVDDSGADRFKRRIRDLRGDVDRPLVADAKLDHHDQGFDRFEKRIRDVRGDARRPIEADARLDVDRRGFDVYSRKVRDADNDTSRLSRSSGRLRSGIGLLGSGVAVAGAAMAGGLALGARKAWQEFEEAAKVGAQTRAVIESTGGAANVTADEVERLAGRLSVKAGMDDEAIQSGQNLLLTFKNIRNEAGAGNDIFNQSTSILVDMAAALGKEPRDAAIQLGKALNDPVKGITALTRVGVSFTDQQKEQITSLVDQGKTMEAQKIILKELNSEFGGSAEAQARPLDRAKVAVLNLFEAIGGKLAPVVEKAANWLADFAGGLTEGEGKAGGLARMVRRARDALEDAGDAIAGVVDHFKILDDGTSKAGDSWVNLVENYKGYARDLWRTVKDTWEAIKGEFEGSGESLSIVGEHLLRIADYIIDIVRRILPGVKQVFGGLARIISGAIDVIAGILTLDFGRAWGGVKKIFSGALKTLWGMVRIGTAPLRDAFAKVGGAVIGAFDRMLDFVADLPGNLWRFLKGAISRVVRWNVEIRQEALEAGRGLLRNVIRFARELPGDLWSLLKRAVSRVLSFQSNVREAALDAGRGILRGVVRFVRDLPGDLWGYLKRGYSRIADFAGDAAGKAREAGARILRGIGDFVSDIPGRVKRGFDRALDYMGGLPGRFAGKVGDIVRAMARGFTNIGSKLAQAVRGAVNKLLPDRIHINLPDKIPGLPDEINISIPQLRRGGKAGPGAGGPVLIFGEGNQDEWWISQEGDRAKNRGWLREAAAALGGRVEFFQGGGSRIGSARKRKPPAPLVNTGTAESQTHASDSTVIKNFDRDLERLQRQYGQMQRRYDLSEETVLVEHDDGSVTVDKDARDKRVGELTSLRDYLRDRIKAKIEEFKIAVEAAIAKYREWITKLSRAIDRIDTANKRKGRNKRSARFYADHRRERAGYVKLRTKYEDRVAELSDASRNLDLDITDVDLDIAELENEIGDFSDAELAKSVRGPTATDTTGGDTGGGTGTDSGATAPSPVDVAREAFELFGQFQAGREELFRSFGSNYVARGGQLFSGEGAGLRYFGAQGGADAYRAGDPVGSPEHTAGGVTIVNNFQEPPPTPHIWTQQQRFEVELAFG